MNLLYRLGVLSPQLADKCDKYDNFTEWQCYILLDKQPQLADRSGFISVVHCTYPLTRILIHQIRSRLCRLYFLVRIKKRQPKLSFFPYPELILNHSAFHRNT